MQNLLFQNWLNYYVYQQTPFDLKDLITLETPQKNLNYIMFNEIIKHRLLDNIVRCSLCFLFTICKDINYFLCFKRLSLLTETRVPTVWNTCTKIIKQITANPITRYWYL